MIKTSIEFKKINEKINASLKKEVNFADEELAKQVYLHFKKEGYDSAIGGSNGDESHFFVEGLIPLLNTFVVRSLNDLYEEVQCRMALVIQLHRQINQTRSLISLNKRTVKLDDKNKINELRKELDSLEKTDWERIICGK